MAINPKSGGLSALDPQDDTVDPQDKEFDYGSDTSDLRSYLASKVKARQQALAELPSYDEYAKNLTEARQPRSNLSQISEALLAYGRPLERGQSQWQALGNAATTLTKGIEAEDTAKRAEQVKRAQLRMQYLKAKSDVVGPYDEAIDKLAIEAYKAPKLPGLAPALLDTNGLALNPFTGQKPPLGIVAYTKAGEGLTQEQMDNLNARYPVPTYGAKPAPFTTGAAGQPVSAAAPMSSAAQPPVSGAPNQNEVKRFTSVDELPSLGLGKYGNLGGQLYVNEGGKIKKVDVAPTIALDPQVQDAIDKGLTGEDFLATLHGPTSSQVRAILKGLAPVPTGARSNPHSQMLAQLAAQADPSLDATDYNVRFKTRQSFTSGPDAANITSINTVIKHLGTLDNQIDNLQNTSFGWLNKPLQETRMALADKGQQEAVSAFKTTKKLAAGELAKAIGGGPAHVQELKEINDLLDSAKTPTELHAAVKSATSLLSSRLEEVGNKYNSAMGLNSHPTSFLSKSNLKMYNRLMGLPEETPQEIEGTTPSNAPPAAKAKPTDAPVKKVLNGVTYIKGPDGWYAQ